MTTSTPYTKTVVLAQLADELAVVVGTRPSLTANQLVVDGAEYVVVAPDTITLTQLDNAIAAHVADPDYEVPQEVRNLRNQVATLHLWADQSRTVSTQGGNVTQAQLKTMFGRLATLLDRFADLLVASQQGS